MKKYVVMDLEMCNVINLACKNKYHLGKEIIQIGAVLLNENLDVIDTFMEYVKPVYGNIDTQIHRLTGIYREDLKDAKSLEEVLYEFINFIPKDAVIVSWSLNDLYQIMDELDEKEIYIEAMESYFETWEDCQEMFSDKMNAYKIYKLSEALRIANIEMDVHEHDALADAINTAKLFKKILVEETLVLSSYYSTQIEEEKCINHPFASLLGQFCFEQE